MSVKSEPKDVQGESRKETVEIADKGNIVLTAQERQFPLSEAEYLKITSIRNAFDYFAWGLILAIIPIGLQILSSYPDIEKWMIKFICWAAFISVVLFLLTLVRPKKKRKVMEKIDRYFEAGEKNNG